MSLPRLYLIDLPESLPLFFYKAFWIIFEETTTSGMYFSGTKPNSVFDLQRSFLKIVILPLFLGLEELKCFWVAEVVLIMGVDLLPLLAFENIFIVSIFKYNAAVIS